MITLGDGDIAQMKLIAQAGRAAIGVMFPLGPGFYLEEFKMVKGTIDLLDALIDGYEALKAHCDLTEVNMKSIFEDVGDGDEDDGPPFDPALETRITALGYAIQLGTANVYDGKTLVRNAKEIELYLLDGAPAQH